MPAGLWSNSGDDMTDSSPSGISRRALLQALLAHAAGGVAWAQARVHAKPRPLAKDAVTHEWASFLGPTHNAVSTETRLSRTLPPALVWEYPKGTSYAAPAVAGGHVVLVHRVGEEEIVELLQPETGMRQWNFRYSTDFEDRYGYNNGPRSSPVIDGDRVFTVGAQGQLHCLDLRSGALVWRRNIGARLQSAAGFLWHRVDPARRRQAAHRQCRRPRRPVCCRARQDDRPRSLARRQGVGPELRIADPRGGARPPACVRVRRRRIHTAHRRFAVD